MTRACCIFFCAPGLEWVPSIPCTAHHLCALCVRATSVFTGPWLPPWSFFFPLSWWQRVLGLPAKCRRGFVRECTHLGWCPPLFPRAQRRLPTPTQHYLTRFHSFATPSWLPLDNFRSLPQRWPAFC